MTPPTVSLAYRKAALQQASTIGLVIALYDTLSGNLTRAAGAMERGDIEVRCSELVHGFKVLHQLDAMLDMTNGGQTAAKLRRFYTHLRGQMLAAQFSVSPATLREQIVLLMEVRGAWHQLDSRSSHSHPPAPPSRSRLDAPGSNGYDEAALQPITRSSFSCSG